MTSLQKIHDLYKPAEWPQELADLARGYNLEPLGGLPKSSVPAGEWL